MAGHPGPSLPPPASDAPYNGAMCGRYALRTSVPELARRLGVEPCTLPAGAANTPARYNIAPTQPVLALRVDDGARRLEAMRWGLVPSWSQGPDARYAMHNARIEGVEAIGDALDPTLATTASRASPASRPTAARCAGAAASCRPTAGTSGARRAGASSPT